MTGTDENPGVIPSAVHDVFAYIHEVLLLFTFMEFATKYDNVLMSFHIDQ
jgi:hypothetical protein